MTHILADSRGLTPRAQRFLATCAQREPFGPSPGGSDAELSGQLHRTFGPNSVGALGQLRHAQDRYGGLSYDSRAWSFEEVITFAPWPSWDEGDGALPLMDLVKHSLALPYAVWLRSDGVVAYCLTGSHDAPVVPVFPSVDALIEADALYRECSDWKAVTGKGLSESHRVRQRASTLTLIEEASGFTEWWWQGDGFRVHVWLTFAEVLRGGARWGVWSRDGDGEKHALAFLAQSRG